MMSLLLVALSAVAQSPSERPRTFLLSVDHLFVGADETVTELEIQTWGVSFRAICHLPHGWRVEAGGNATPEGNLAADEGRQSPLRFQQASRRSGSVGLLNIAAEPG